MKRRARFAVGAAVGALLVLSSVELSDTVEEDEEAEDAAFEGEIVASFRITRFTLACDASDGTTTKHVSRSECSGEDTGKLLILRDEHGKYRLILSEGCWGRDHELIRYDRERLQFSFTDETTFGVPLTWTLSGTVAGDRVKGSLAAEWHGKNYEGQDVGITCKGEWSGPFEFRDKPSARDDVIF